MDKATRQAIQMALVAFCDGYAKLKDTLYEACQAHGISRFEEIKELATETVAKMHNTTTKIVDGELCLNKTGDHYEAAKSALRRIREAMEAERDGPAKKAGDTSPLGKWCASTNVAKKRGVTYTQALKALKKIYGIE